MNIPRSIVIDLLPLYLAGEVSQETRELVEQYLQTDPEMAALADKSVIELPRDVPIPLTQEEEMKALNYAKRLIFWRTVIVTAVIAFMVLALFGGALLVLVMRMLL
jgi:anti-sigma-K factor RskA